MTTSWPSASLTERRPGSLGRFLVPERSLGSSSEGKAVSDSARPLARCRDEPPDAAGLSPSRTGPSPGAPHGEGGPATRRPPTGRRLLSGAQAAISGVGRGDASVAVCDPPAWTDDAATDPSFHRCPAIYPGGWTAAPYGRSVEVLWGCVQSRRLEDLAPPSRSLLARLSGGASWRGRRPPGTRGGGDCRHEREDGAFRLCEYHAVSEGGAARDREEALQGAPRGPPAPEVRDPGRRVRPLT